MALGVIGRAEEDVGTDNAAEIAPADDEPKDDALAIDALNVVSHLGDSVKNIGVDAKYAKEGANVLDSVILAD